MLFSLKIFMCTLYMVQTLLILYLKFHTNISSVVNTSTWQLNKFGWSTCSSKLIDFHIRKITKIIFYLYGNIQRKMNGTKQLFLSFQDGKASSATVVGAFFSFLHLFDSPEQSMHIFSVKRGPPGVTPSQKR